MYGIRVQFSSKYGANILKVCILFSWKVININKFKMNLIIKIIYFSFSSMGIGISNLMINSSKLVKVFIFSKLK